MNDSNGDRQRTVMMQASVVAVFLFVMIAVTGLALVATGFSTGSAEDAKNVIEVTVKEWSVQAQPVALTGPTTFVVTNAGTMPHELLVLQTELPANGIPLTHAGDPPEPVSTGADRVDEDMSIAETGGEPLEPGEVRSFSVDLPPGHYVLICNLAGHYQNGMRKALTVF